MRARIAAIVVAFGMLFGIGAATADAARAESIIDQFESSKTVTCHNSTFVLTAVIQVTDLVRYRSTYYRARRTGGSELIRYFNFRTTHPAGTSSGYYGPAPYPGATDTGYVFDPSPWYQNPPFRVYGSVELTNGWLCGDFLLYGP